MIPKRLKRPKMGLRESSVVRCQPHIQWTGGNTCAIAGRPGHVCATGRSHAHHVQSYRAIEGGMGMKVGDDKVVPLCSTAHGSVHTDGQGKFERKWGVDLELEARVNWDNSPHGKKYRLQHMENE